MSRHWGKQGLASHENLMGQVLDLLDEVSLESLVRRREKRKLLSVESQEEQKRMMGHWVLYEAPRFTTSQRGETTLTLKWEGYLRG